MKSLVTVFGPDDQPVAPVMVKEGERQQVAVKSRYLVSAGQTMMIGISVHDPEKTATTSLIDARDVAGVVIPRVWDVSYVPTTRPLQDVLGDVAAHGRTHPHHGHDCVCMDAYIRELRLQISRAVPPDTGDRKDVHLRLDARRRMHHVLYTVARDL